MSTSRPTLPTDAKDGNPKDAIGSRKVPIHLVPHRVLGEVALALLEGAIKYKPYNYRTAGVRVTVYLDAAWRHLARYLEGEDLDPDSGLHHVVKAIASLIVLRDGILQGNVTDDRPPAAAEWITTQNRQAADLIDQLQPRALP